MRFFSTLKDNASRIPSFASPLRSVADPNTVCLHTCRRACNQVLGPCPPALGQGGGNMYRIPDEIRYKTPQHGREWKKRGIAKYQRPAGEDGAEFR